MTTTNISLPPVVTRADWLVARKQLLAKEKELTRRRDALNRRGHLITSGASNRSICLG